MSVCLSVCLKISVTTEPIGLFSSELLSYFLGGCFFFLNLSNTKNRLIKPLGAKPIGARGKAASTLYSNKIEMCSDLNFFF